MKITVETRPAEGIAADWLIVGLFEDEPERLPPRGLGEALGPSIRKLRSAKDFEGKRFELLPIYEPAGVAAARLLLVGLGKAERLDRHVLYRAAAAAARSIARKERERVVWGPLPTGTALSFRQDASEIVAGTMTGVFGPDRYQTEKSLFPMQELVLACEPEESAAGQAAIERGQTIGGAIVLARRLVDMPPAELYPESFCAIAADEARAAGVGVEVLEPEQLRALKMGCLLGVGGGSARPPRLLVLRYQGTDEPDAKLLCYVGKGITFDSGGLSLKTADGMKDMKGDMAGAATVLAAMLAIARLRLPIRLVTLAPLAENMPDGSAIRPGDVLTAKTGKTIEVVNTDAEGRLVLADALAHAVDLGADHIVDLATLTGACMIALGTQTAGLMTNDQSWADRVLAAARATGEPVWQLPMFDDFDEQIKSDVADMKNSGGRHGGAITAAKLLERFVGKVPWTHVDIAGPAFVENKNGNQPSGGTGYFVRTLVELAQLYQTAPAAG